MDPFPIYPMIPEVLRMSDPIHTPSEIDDPSPVPAIDESLHRLGVRRWS